MERRTVLRGAVALATAGAPGLRLDPGTLLSDSPEVTTWAGIVQWVQNGGDGPDEVVEVTAARFDGAIDRIEEVRFEEEDKGRAYADDWEYVGLAYTQTWNEANYEAERDNFMAVLVSPHGPSFGWTTVPLTALTG